MQSGYVRTSAVLGWVLISTLSQGANAFEPTELFKSYQRKFLEGQAISFKELPNASDPKLDQWSCKSVATSDTEAFDFNKIPVVYNSRPIPISYQVPPLNRDYYRADVLCMSLKYREYNHPNFEVLSPNVIEDVCRRDHLRSSVIFLDEKRQSIVPPVLTAEIDQPSRAIYEQLATNHRDGAISSLSAVQIDDRILVREVTLNTLGDVAAEYYHDCSKGKEALNVKPIVWRDLLPSASPLTEDDKSEYGESPKMWFRVGLGMFELNDSLVPFIYQSDDVLDYPVITREREGARSEAQQRARENRIKKNSAAKKQKMAHLGNPNLRPTGRSLKNLAVIPEQLQPYKPHTVPNPDLITMPKLKGKNVFAFGYVGPHTCQVGQDERKDNCYWNGLTPVTRKECIGGIVHGGLKSDQKTKWYLCTRAINH